MYSVKRFSFTGLAYVPIAVESDIEAHSICARRLREARKYRFPVATLARGSAWEIGEPVGCVMVPDACGILAIVHITFECRECGCCYETRDDALACCADDACDYCNEGE